VHSTSSTYRRPHERNASAARRAALALLGALVCALAAPALSHAETAPATPPPAGSNPNEYECSGHIGAGKAEAGAEETPVQYTFLCNGQITGYQLQTQLPITGIEGSPSITNFGGTPLTDSFSCSGTFPGYAANCVGASTKEAFERVTGQFEIGWKLCTEPRVDPLLTVTYAYLEKGVITQAISGPFDLGRPHGCPASAQGGKDRLSAYQGPEPTAKSHKKGKRGKKGSKRSKKTKAQGKGK
jgi:hypothetical protein